MSVLDMRITSSGLGLHVNVNVDGVDNSIHIYTYTALCTGRMLVVTTAYIHAYTHTYMCMYIHTCTNTHVSGHLFKWALIRTASTCLCLLSHDWWNNTSMVTTYCFRNNCPMSVDPYHPRGCSVVFTCGVLAWYLSMAVDSYHHWDWPMVFRKGNRLLWHLCSQLWLKVDLVFYKMYFEAFTMLGSIPDL